MDRADRSRSPQPDSSTQPPGPPYNDRPRPLRDRKDSKDRKVAPLPALNLPLVRKPADPPEELRKAFPPTNLPVLVHSMGSLTYKDGLSHFMERGIFSVDANKTIWLIKRGDPYTRKVVDEIDHLFIQKFSENEKDGLQGGSFNVYENLSNQPERYKEITKMFGANKKLGLRYTRSRDRSDPWTVYRWKELWMSLFGSVKGLGPQIYAAQFKYNTLYILMEHGEDIGQFVGIKSSDKSNIPNILGEHLLSQLKQASKSGMVLGDVKRGNMIVVQGDLTAEDYKNGIQEKKEIRFIDFDPFFTRFLTILDVECLTFFNSLLFLGTLLCFLQQTNKSVHWQNFMLPVQTFVREYMEKNGNDAGVASTCKKLLLEAMGKDAETFVKNGANQGLHDFYTMQDEQKILRQLVYLGGAYTYNRTIKKEAKYNCFDDFDPQQPAIMQLAQKIMKFSPSRPPSPKSNVVVTIHDDVDNTLSDRV